MPEDRSDADLLDAMRSGDPHAYEELWHRHFDSGLRYARRLFPSRAEDLVSESFLSIYQQVGVAGTGPESVFRPYLKAVIRNTAAHWRRDAARLVDTEDLEPVDHRDRLSRVEQAESAEILATFGEAPGPVAARALALRGRGGRALRHRTGARNQTERGVGAARARTNRHEAPLARPAGAEGAAPRSAHVARLLPRHPVRPRGCGARDRGRRASSAASTATICSEDARIRDPGAGRGALGRSARGARRRPARRRVLSTTTAAAAVVTTAGSGLAAWAIGAGVATATVGGLVLTSLFTVSAPPEQPTALVTGAGTRAGRRRFRTILRHSRARRRARASARAVGGPDAVPVRRCFLTVPSSRPCRAHSPRR
jgi:DNA-directed RNA polymerase specialized sigma24 family protein